MTTLVRCEPLVRVGSLVRALDRLGWTLPIVPEMEDLSLGGLVMGTGLETSSHRHGLFQNICRRWLMDKIKEYQKEGETVSCIERNQFSPACPAMPTQARGKGISLFASANIFYLLIKELCFMYELSILL